MKKCFCESVCEECIKFHCNIELAKNELRIKELKESIRIRESYKENHKKKKKEIQLKLHHDLGGNIEVQTDSGFIDLLTDTEIIEIKNGKKWKQAIGQILIYSSYYPEHTKRIHLFGIKMMTILIICVKYIIFTLHMNNF